MVNRKDTIIPDIAAAVPLKADMEFESVSTYTLKNRLGEGGMGDVWLAERLSAGAHSQLVAIKFLRSRDAGEILADEALRVSLLSHDNIVPFVDSGRDAEGRFFVAMAYVNGVDLVGLRKMVGSKYRLPDPMVGFIVFMVLRALNYAHTYRFENGDVGLIHRDVSPGNILIDEIRGFVKLTDFGVALRKSATTQKSTIAGKVPYMAPEVLREEKVDARADLYSLGLVAYELITGINPNVESSQFSNVFGAITNIMLALEHPVRPPDEVMEGVDPFLSRIVAKLLETSEDDRYPSAQDAINDLALCLYDNGVGPTTDSLATYMKMLRNPDSLELVKKTTALPFFEAGEGGRSIRPKRILTKKAAESLIRGVNPGREV